MPLRDARIRLPSRCGVTSEGVKCSATENLVMDDATTTTASAPMEGLGVSLVIRRCRVSG